MKKLLLVLKDLPRGGVEEAFYSISSGLSDKGFESDIIILSKNIDDFELQRFKQVCGEVFVHSGGWVSGVLLIFSKLSSKKYSVTLSAKEKSNLAVVVASFLTLVFKFIKIVNVLTRHVSIDRKISGGDASLLTPLLYFFYRFFNTRVVCCSKALSAEVSRYYGLKDCKSIYNPILGSGFAKRVALPVTVSLSDYCSGKEKKVLFVGRLAKQKGCDILLSACADVSRNIHIFIAGDGEDRHDLEIQARDVMNKNENVIVTFLGMQPNPIQLMRQADLLVMPSRWEGLPTVLIEALGVGVPVLSANCFSGPSEIIPRDYHGACLFEVDNAKQLKKKISNAEYSEYYVSSFDREAFSDVQCVANYQDVMGLI